MTIVPEALREANQQLVALSGRYADGELQRPEFRQTRRRLICEALGLDVPEVPTAHDELDLPDEDDTMPGDGPEAGVKASSGVMPAEEAAEAPVPETVSESPSPEQDSEEEPAPQEEPAGEAPKVRDSTLQITLLLLLLAFVGLGGLLWFVLR